MSDYTAADVARFWSKVDRAGGPAACWLWLAAVTGKGYGVFQMRNRARRAHRVALEVSTGSTLPSYGSGAVVMHRCDNPRCVNPGHLSVGTSEQNRLDCISKGRHIRGERHHKSKLSWRQVARLRAEWAKGASVTALARRFRIGRSAAWSAATGRHWKGK